MNAAKERPHKETKVSHLDLFFPVTKKVGTIGNYRLDTCGLHLVRTLRGCRIENPK
ncbi:hypothetical protein GALL_463580 [mine drainage metagenome]|uniref:Uncharacterized protein n=1 Tax=mine drainage metagenome TaxID=410659 RepID=A0A1J5PMK2_9ZZZZ